MEKSKIIVGRKYTLTEDVRSDMFPDRVYLRKGAIVKALEVREATEVVPENVHVLDLSEDKTDYGLWFAPDSKLEEYYERRDFFVGFVCEDSNDGSLTWGNIPVTCNVAEDKLSYDEIMELEESLAEKMNANSLHIIGITEIMKDDSNE